MEKLPRMNLVNTAVKFLQNPKVQDSSRKDQTAFLEKKGLTKDEIDMAFDQLASLDTPQHQMVPLRSQAAEVSTWSRVRENFLGFLIVGGVSYAAFKMFKTYLLPLMWEDPDEKRLRAMEERSERQMELAENMLKEMREMLTLMKDDIRSQNSRIDALSRSHDADVVNFNEIKSGITTLKGLLLNRKQFPPTPVSQPLIPAWQRETPSGNDGRTTPQSSDSSPRDESKSSSSWVALDASPNGVTDSTLLASVNDSATEQPPLSTEQSDLDHTTTEQRQGTANADEQ